MLLVVPEKRSHIDPLEVSCWSSNMSSSVSIRCCCIISKLSLSMSPKILLEDVYGLKDHLKDVPDCSVLECSTRRTCSR